MNACLHAQKGILQCCRSVPIHIDENVIFIHGDFLDSPDGWYQSYRNPSDATVGRLVKGELIEYD
jgi:hypothetical protein